MISNVSKSVNGIIVSFGEQENGSANLAWKQDHESIFIGAKTIHAYDTNLNLTININDPELILQVHSGLDDGESFLKYKRVWKIMMENLCVDAMIGLITHINNLSKQQGVEQGRKQKVKEFKEWMNE